MKFYKLLLTAALSLSFQFMNAQTIEAPNCTELNITSFPAVGFILYPANLTVTGNDPCALVSTLPSFTLKVRFILERLNPATGNFSPVGGLSHGLYQYDLTFDGLAKGTYRVRFDVPIRFPVPQCRRFRFAKVFNSLGQDIGWLGSYLGDPNIFSNEVIIGAPDVNDISYTFIDPNETGAEQTYDFGETVIIDASASTHYDQWNIAIFESGPTYNRFQSGGWTIGTVGTYDIANVWPPAWGYQPFHSYKIQFATQNSKCLTWNKLDRTFFICPAGSGCRFGIDDKEILVSPNPASTFISFEKFNPEVDLDYRLIMTDISGRRVKQTILQSDQLDISDLPNGMFVISILKDGKQVFNTKLVVNH